MPRYPVDNLILPGIGGGFGEFRPKQGPSGTWHWGIDLAGKTGDPVFAPEDMSVVHVWSDDKTAPFVGYGPAGVLARGTGSAAAEDHYHLLAHLDPAGWDPNGLRENTGGKVLTPTIGEHCDEGQQVGIMSTLRHVHWEIRRDPIDSPATRGGNTFDPKVWVKTGGGLQQINRDDPSGTSWLWWLLGLYILTR